MEGLQIGRALFKKWGFRRCEDISWLKSNKHHQDEAIKSDETSIFHSTVEHCLVGMRGVVRRSSDSHIIHCNLDVDVIVSDMFPHGSTRKPEQLYDIIERFCLGRRRLELFGEVLACFTVMAVCVNTCCVCVCVCMHVLNCMLTR